MSFTKCFLPSRMIKLCSWGGQGITAQQPHCVNMCKLAILSFVLNTYQSQAQASQSRVCVRARRGEHALATIFMNSLNELLRTFLTVFVTHYMQRINKWKFVVIFNFIHTYLLSTNSEDKCFLPFYITLFGYLYSYFYFILLLSLFQ